MFFNPFPIWYIILIVIPINLLCSVTYLPYFVLRIIGLGKPYKRIHGFVWINVEQLTLDPINYFKNFKEINIQIVDELKRI